MDKQELKNRFELLCASKNTSVEERLSLWMQFDIFGDKKILNKLYEK